MYKAILLCCAVIFLGGCESAGSWRYDTKSNSMHEGRVAPANVALAVLPFEDMRSNDNTNATLLYMIPLMPYGYSEYNRIEGGNGFLTHGSYQIRPREDLANSLVDELKHNNVARDIFFTQRATEPNVDYYLQGYVQEFRYNGKIFSYGLSVYGPLLWFIGLPAGSANNTLSVDLEMKDARTGEVVWRGRSFSSNRSLISGLYYNWGKEFDAYPEMMAEAISIWIADLNNFLASSGKKVNHF